MQVRDRIVGLRRVKAAELRPHPKNWRTHPKAQQEALRGILAEVGYADALIARQTEDGSLELIDGHLRAETTPDQEVPVLVLDVSKEEAEKLGNTLHMLAFCPGGILFYYLLYKSGVVPRALSLWGIITTFPMLVGTTTQIFGYTIPPFFYVPYIPFEWVIGVWILIKGIPETKLH